MYFFCIYRPNIKAEKYTVSWYPRRKIQVNNTQIFSPFLSPTLWSENNFRFFYTFNVEGCRGIFRWSSCRWKHHPTHRRLAGNSVHCCMQARRYFTCYAYASGEQGTRGTNKAILSFISLSQGNYLLASLSLSPVLVLLYDSPTIHLFHHIISETSAAITLASKNVPYKKYFWYITSLLLYLLVC